MARIWVANGPIDEELCLKEKRLQEFGLYRRLNNGNYEFISYCDTEINQWLGIHGADLEQLLDKYSPN